jgi:DNA-damage-inducible protein D
VAEEPYSGMVEDLIRTIESAANRASDGSEFWSARTLMSIMGYANSSWEDFKEVVLKAQYACERSDQRIDAHFSSVVVSVLNERNDDIKVTRYGAYLIAQNGDTRKKQVAYAQTYFATQARRQELQERMSSSTKDEQRRLAMREKIAEHNKSLADAARKAGVEAPADFARFQNFGYKGLYNGLDVHGIRNAKRLSAKAKILDHMDITELAANFFRATQAEDKLRRENIHGKDEANAAHFEVGCKVRKAIKDIGGTMPEGLPVAENIDDVRKRIAKLDNKT